MGRWTYKRSRDIGLVNRLPCNSEVRPIGIGLATDTAMLNTLDLGIDYGHALSLS